jgi:hypothetical protein
MILCSKVSINYNNVERKHLNQSHKHRVSLESAGGPEDSTLVFLVARKAHAFHRTQIQCRDLV